MRYLERIAALNPRVTRPSVHISLNFPPAEEHLSDARLCEVATAYMQGIGFGNQPWLAYRHTDAGHPHLHIVSVKVRPDGTRIDMHNLGRNQSEEARKDVEKNFSLIPAQRKSETVGYTPEPVSATRVKYGKAPTKKAISRVLQFVLEQYRYSTLGELNAVLGLYNIRADRGKVTSRTFVSGGLLYRALDPEGMPLGVPIKASDFAFPATLVYLEKHFGAGKAALDENKGRLRLAIDRALGTKGVTSLSTLGQAIKPAGIDLVLHYAVNGQVHGVTWVDHKNHCSANGSGLGKAYSAKGLLERLTTGLRDDALGHQPSAGNTVPHPPKGDAVHPAAMTQKESGAANNGVIPLEAFLQPENNTEYVAGAFKGNKKKKRKNGRR
ncbi:MAG: relaxase/mobilization nuclease domain-containing protein [Bacteroidia bacterium]